MSRELRTLSVPEGVEGERIDSALTRVLGLSRTSVVKLLEAGDILVLYGSNTDIQNFLK